ncbi:glycoside hydrolase family 5 protein [Auriscalpium vulgare]|uniref:Glycoside hydrolase family 5 protein n=1 Tax=Auriscalpium vulgare TaxID=40419 RepID=A0ACB8RHP9_9AGAM|nr:glycoside hydrolase family 5 protein [Auriscalpium vulgare]
MKLVGTVVLAISLASFSNAVAVWQQCGGLQYTGSTTCDAGLSCVYLNDYYSQCQAVSSTVSSTTASSSSTSRTSSTSSSTGASSPTGFVKTSGQKFTLNGAPFTVVGSNSYWVGLTGLSTANMNAAFKDIANAGATTVRTWGFNEVTSTGSSSAYYQSWSGSTPTVNTGSNGLGNFDNVVAAAKANGLRLIVALTNNWSDYGGMDVYVNQILGSGQPHDYFYTNSQVINAYKNYVKTFVSRYVNEPTILGWELSNEPRCSGSTSATSGTCTTTTITNWATTISAYIKSIDSNHLVAIGDEGFFNEPSNPSYPYQGTEGIDFAANLKISSIDFGTFHLYPGSWSVSPADTWGAQWIADHATVQKSVNKPTILEEFGVTSSQSSVYATWWSEVSSSGLSGDLIWQAGSHLSSGDTPQDGYAIFPDNSVYQQETAAAAALKARG